MTLSLVFAQEDTGVLSGDCVNGRGAYRWTNGNTYDGDWVEGKRHGKGTHTWASGTYDGDWTEGEMHGRGIMTYKGVDKRSGWWWMGHTASQDEFAEYAMEAKNWSVKPEPG